MKYRIISKRTIYRTQAALIPLEKVVPYSENANEKEREQILLDTLFEFSALPEAKKISRLQKLRERYERLDKK